MRSGLLLVSFDTTVGKLIDVRPSTAALVLGLTASLTACARPGDSPSGTPTARSEVTLMASLAPGPPQVVGPSHFAPVPGTPAVGCGGRRIQPARPARPVSPRPRPTSGPEFDAAERARRALEAANPPLPRLGPLPSEAAAQAETCARNLSPQLTLLMHGAVPLDERTLRRFLTGEGLTGVVIGPGLDFAAATGKACVHGHFTADGPALSIGPPAANGTCHP
jgi:hypothetical protein